MHHTLLHAPAKCFSRNVQKMPSRTRSSRDREEDSDNQSPASAIPLRRSERPDIPLDIKAKIIHQVVRYSLCCEFKRKTIKRSDITSAIITPLNVEHPTNAFKVLLPNIQQYLYQNFGMKLQSAKLVQAEDFVANSTSTSATASTATQGSGKRRIISPSGGEDEFHLISVLPPEFKAIAGPLSNDMEANFMGLMYAIVSIVLLYRSSVMPEVALVQLLEVFVGRDIDIPNTLKSLSRYRYLKLIKTQAGNDKPDEKGYAVGSRAIAEINPATIHDVCAELVGDMYNEDRKTHLSQKMNLLGMTDEALDKEFLLGEEGEEAANSSEP